MRLQIRAVEPQQARPRRRRVVYGTDGGERVTAMLLPNDQIIIIMKRLSRRQSPQIATFRCVLFRFSRRRSRVRITYKFKIIIILSCCAATKQVLITSADTCRVASFPGGKSR